MKKEVALSRARCMVRDTMQRLLDRKTIPQAAHFNKVREYCKKYDIAFEMDNSRLVVNNESVWDLVSIRKHIMNRKSIVSEEPNRKETKNEA